MRLLTVLLWALTASLASASGPNPPRLNKVLVVNYINGNRRGLNEPICGNIHEVVSYHTTPDSLYVLFSFRTAIVT